MIALNDMIGLSPHDAQILVSASVSAVIIIIIMSFTFIRVIKELKLKRLQKDDFSIGFLIKRRENSDEYQRICKILAVEQESHLDCIKSWDKDFRSACGCFSCRLSATTPLLNTIHHYICTEFISHPIPYDTGDDAA